jgi:L-fuconolactonase
LNPHSDKQSWLARTTESVLDAHVPLIDAHHHLWHSVSFSSYVPYEVPEYEADIAGGHRVIASVYVDCLSHYHETGSVALRPVGETAYAESVARQGSSSIAGMQLCAAIIPYSDLMLGSAVGETLDAHTEASPDRFRGIRQSTVWDKSEALQVKLLRNFPQMMGTAAFRSGFTELQKRRLSFDAWLYHPQLPELIALARDFPDVTIVMDHMGGPLGIGPYAGKKPEVFEQWAGAINLLGRCSNVYAKLGGVNMPLNGYAWEDLPAPPSSDQLVEATGDLYHRTIDAFTPARCMFESNFPADKESCSYTVLWNAFKRIAARYSELEQAQLLRETAARVYKIGHPNHL